MVVKARQSREKSWTSQLSFSISFLPLIYSLSQVLQVNLNKIDPLISIRQNHLEQLKGSEWEKERESLSQIKPPLSTMAAVAATAETTKALSPQPAAFKWSQHGVQLISKSTCWFYRRELSHLDWHQNMLTHTGNNKWANTHEPRDYHRSNVDGFA